ncbi:hypothetical protein SLS54_005536 [Diplodia seriata]
MALLVINGVARTFQILCAAVVLGLSITLIRSQSYGTVAANNYAAFTGGFGLLVGLVGAAAIFIEPLAGIVMVAADALAELFLLAGGIVSSSKSDENEYKLYKNELTNGGCIKDNKGNLRDCGSHSVDNALDRCVKNSADAAFMIITAVFCMSTVVTALLAMKRGGGIGRKAEIDCAYDVPEGQTRTAALKSHTAQLQTRVSTSVSLLWALKMAPPDEAARILERIKSSPDPSHVLDQPAGLDLLDSTPTSAPQDPTLQPPPPSPSSTSVDTLHPSNQHRLLSSVFALLRSPATREAFRLFLQCTGLLFHVFTKAQGGAALQEVQDNDDAAISKASICEVCAMAALGSQYSQGRISSETGHYFYNVARQYLDDAIAADPLRAMKACALLAMYNILKKASVSLVYVGMHPLSHEYIVRVPLQHDLNINKKSGNAPSEADACSADTIQMKMTQIAIIKAKLSQTAFAFTEISKDDINSVKADLRRWSDQLDPSMQLAQLLAPTINLDSRRGIHLMHCLHLGATIYLQRQIFYHYVPTTRSDLALADDTIRDLCDSIEEGFAASMTSARVLGLIYAYGGVLQRCWLCIFQSYIATAEILFMVVQRLLHGFPVAQCRPDLALASQSLAVLSFCASADHLAGELLDSVQSHYDYLVFMTEDDAETIEQMYCFSPPRETFQAHPSLTWETLLKVPPGESQLHEVSRHLMSQICSPFENINAVNQNGFEGPIAAYGIPMPLSSAEEIALGARLDWSAETGLCGPTAADEFVENVSPQQRRLVSSN